ncbi:hypothetical protein EON77_18595 [bacterium]|nr:MAG: hypothetical protein EON77_18595 [bacterium]
MTIKEIMAEEDTRIGLLVGWNVILPVLTIMSFYFGTITVSKHIVDLQVHDLVNALPYAGFGAAIGTAIGLFLTFVYPKMVHRDLRREHAVGYEAHREEGDSQPTTHVTG